MKSDAQNIVRHDPFRLLASQSGRKLKVISPSKNKTTKINRFRRMRVLSVLREIKVFESLARKYVPHSGQ